jgi:hypothetical protein
MLCLDLGVPLIRFEFRTYRAGEGGIRFECQFADFGTTPNTPTGRPTFAREQRHSRAFGPLSGASHHRCLYAGPRGSSRSLDHRRRHRCNSNTTRFRFLRILARKNRCDPERPSRSLKEHFLGAPAVGRTNPHVHLRRATNSIVGLPSRGRPNFEPREQKKIELSTRGRGDSE